MPAVYMGSKPGTNAVHTCVIRASRDGAAETWELTAIDRANLLLTLRGTWVFGYSPDVEELKRSLSETLSFYPHLCGRMVGGKKVLLNNEGVPFSERNLKDVSVADALARPELADRFSSPLNKGQIKQGREAPLRVTVNRLEDGVVLGVRCTHACLDGMGFYGLVDNWSKQMRGEPFDPPRADQTLIPAPTTRKPAVLKAEARERDWHPLGVAAVLRALVLLARGTFRCRALAMQLSSDQVAGLRSRLREVTGLPLTRHGALSAHLLSIWPVLFGIPEGIALQQTTVMDARGRLPGLPETFVGNGAWNAVTARVASGSPVAEIAREVHRGLAPYFRIPSDQMRQEMQLAIDLASHKILRLPFRFGDMLRSTPPLMYTNNFSRAPVYSPDFGGGPPVGVIPHDLPDPVLIWPAPPADGGVELYFNSVVARRFKLLKPDHPFFEKMRVISGEMS